MFPADTSTVAATRSGDTAIRESTMASPTGSLTSTCSVPKEIDGVVEELPHAMHPASPIAASANLNIFEIIIELHS